MRTLRSNFLRRTAVGFLCALAIATPALAAAPQRSATAGSVPQAPAAPKRDRFRDAGLRRSAERPKLDASLQERSRDRAGTSRVIIELHDGAAAAGATRGLGAKLGRQLRTFNGTVAQVPNKLLQTLAASPLVKSIYLDRPIGGEMNRVAVTTGARTVNKHRGFDGRGVGVAVIDSGITGWHADLAGSGLNGEKIVQFVDFVNGQPTPYDDNGHGTHVAGIIAGNGHDSAGAGAGIAPRSHLVGLKVLDQNGAGHISDVIAALDWVVANHAAYNIRVVNLSVGAPITESYWTDPLALAAKAAVEAGVVVVAAAGNMGKDAAGQIRYGGITAPGNAPWVLTVGASSHMGTIERWDDTLADYSSRGPSRIDYGAKPDLVAPGTGIVSLSDPSSTFYTTQSAFLLGGEENPAYLPYLSLSGTSMAAPIVSGTVALMLQANPSLTPNAVKAILEYTAQVMRGHSPLIQGAGLLNAFGAVELARFYRTAVQGAQFPTSPYWSRSIVWGNHLVERGIIMPSATAWATNVVWGAERDASGDNIVWGTSCPAGADCENIVWGNTDLAENIVWGVSDGTDNIVWGVSLDTNGDGQTDNIVWGSAGDENIVWGVTADALDNIVWGNSSPLVDENIVWGNDCGGADCENIVWGTTVADSGGGENIVWGVCETLENIVWGQNGDIENIVWGQTGDVNENIVWGQGAGEENIVWGSAAANGVTFGKSSHVPLSLKPSEFGELFAPDAPAQAPTVPDSTSPNPAPTGAPPPPTDPAPPADPPPPADPAPPVDPAPTDPPPPADPAPPVDPAPTDPPPPTVISTTSWTTSSSQALEDGTTVATTVEVVTTTMSDGTVTTSTATTTTTTTPDGTVTTATSTTTTTGAVGGGQ